MMSDEIDQFEQRLRRQPMKQIPADWRSEILAAATAAQAPEKPVASHVSSSPSWYARISREIMLSVWPNPKAWAGLAAVWVLILALNFSTRDAAPAPVLAEKPVPASPERIAELKQQQRLFAEVAGLADPSDADRPKNLPLPPHSQRAGWVTI